MAIDKGIAIVCADLQQVGGIKHVLLREWTTADGIVYDSNAHLHEITSIKDASDPAEWYIYEFKSQEASMTVNATKENGSTSFECGLSFMLPRMTSEKFAELQAMQNTCMMAIAVDNNDQAFVLGVSDQYVNAVAASRSQTYVSLASMEGGTGSAFTDDNGITVNLTCKQYELPREYTGTITYYTDGTPSTIYKAETTT